MKDDIYAQIPEEMGGGGYWKLKGVEVGVGDL